ncbi:MAG: hypothetical protein QNJ46_09960 [Leptolyngbyaceae cyanobacterium MO_188.B28]|nr:hypothetical protein [Leptolyngbyaceae cyanobacterium MO_188.B28]
MTISEGRLRLAVCDQSQSRVKTIDLFLQSLVVDQQSKAIAIEAMRKLQHFRRATS